MKHFFKVRARMLTEMFVSWRNEANTVGLIITAPLVLIILLVAALVLCFVKVPE